MGDVLKPQLDAIESIPLILPPLSLGCDLSCPSWVHADEPFISPVPFLWIKHIPLDKSRINTRPPTPFASLSPSQPSLYVSLSLSLSLHHHLLSGPSHPITVRRNPQLSHSFNNTYPAPKPLFTLTAPNHPFTHPPTAPSFDRQLPTREIQGEPHHLKRVTVSCDRPTDHQTNRPTHPTSALVSILPFSTMTTS